MAEVSRPSGDKYNVTFLLAKERTLHVFSDTGKSVAVSLRERDRNIAVFEAAEAIPVGVHVEWVTAPCGADSLPTTTGGQVLSCRPATAPLADLRAKPLLEISVEFSDFTSAETSGETSAETSGDLAP